MKMSLTGQKIWEFFKKQGKVLAGHFCYDPFWPKIKAFFTEKRWAKLRIILGGVLVALVVAMAIFPSTTHAIVGGIVGSFLATVVEALLNLLGAIGEAFNYVVRGDGPFGIIIGNDAVRIGWTATRDICNLAFVLILLGIGFATILRVPTYHVKKLIIPFIVALLLINFSKLICGVITDFCHIIMASFAAAMTGGSNYSGSLAQSIGVADWLTPPASQAEGDEWKWVGSLVIILLFVLVLIFAFLLIVILLVVRWITLVILTIFSPLVYAAQILPTTKSFAKKWWQQFLQNAFYGPVAVFMVYLALTIAKGATFANASKGAQGTKDFLSVQALLGLVVVCVLLYKAVTMSKSMGIAGASAVISTGTKWGKKALGAAAAPLTERAKAAWGARKAAVQASRKEWGEKWGTGRLARATMISPKGIFGKGAAQAKSRQAQDSFKMKQEKEADNQLSPEQMSTTELHRARQKYRNGSAEAKALDLDMARRGDFGPGDKFLPGAQASLGNASTAHKARFKDSLRLSRPDIADFGGQNPVEEAQNRDEFIARSFDPKKVNARAFEGAKGQAVLSSILSSRPSSEIETLQKREGPAKKAFNDAVEAAVQTPASRDAAVRPVIDPATGKPDASSARRLRTLRQAHTRGNNEIDPSMTLEETREFGKMTGAEELAKAKYIDSSGHLLHTDEHLAQLAVGMGTAKMKEANKFSETSSEAMGRALANKYHAGTISPEELNIAAAMSSDPALSHLITI